jgi:DNA-binding Lrp family transcriptional regulator
MPKSQLADRVDARLLLALIAAPRATTVALAERLGLARNTVHARLDRLETGGALGGFERRIEPRVLGYPLRAFILAKVVQRRLDEVSEALVDIPEILEVHGLSGVADLIIHVVARDADDLYRIAGHILGVKGVRRTTTALVMRNLVGYRIAPLVTRLEDKG